MRRFFWLLIFPLIYFLRLFLVNCQPSLPSLLKFSLKCVEYKTNSYLKIAGIIESIDRDENKGWVIKLDRFLIKINNFEKMQKNFDLKAGEAIEVTGRLKVRVINNFFKEIWLVNPEIVKIYPQADFGGKLSYNLRQKLKLALINFRELTLFFRNNLTQKFRKLLPEPQAGLLSGLVLGEGGQIEADFWRALKKTGALHLVAASGMNLSLVAKISLDWLLKLFSRRLSYFLTLIFILIYCFLAGATPAVLRAGIMISLVFLGLVLGKEISGGWTLFLAGALMLLVNPFLLFNISFQLSFGAMAGMIWLKPWLTSLFGFLVKNLSLSLKKIQDWNLKPNLKREQKGWFFSQLISFKELEKIQTNEVFENPQPVSQTQMSQNFFVSLLNSVLETFAAQITTFPILYFTFGQVQLWSFLPNLMVIWLVPFLTLSGFIILIFILIYFPLAQITSWLVWPALTYFVWIINWWSKLLN